jgi:hypothetical protein
MPNWKLGGVPRDFWRERWEKQPIIDFHLKNPLEGYRRLTFTMLDGDVVAVRPASFWRVLKEAGLLTRWKTQPSRKGTGFEKPLQPHEHWHMTFPISTGAAPFTTFAACWMATVVSSWVGTCGSRCERPT